MTHARRVLAACPRAPLLARGLFVGACVVALAGAAPPSSLVAPTNAVVAADREADGRALLVMAPRVIELRATRNRPLPAKPARVPRVAPPKITPRPITWMRPCAAGVNSAYGLRWGRMHKGIDFAASYGDPLYAIGDGVIVGVGEQSEEGGYGQITLIRHVGGIVSAYAHQSRTVVHLGDHVRAGQLIGYAGATGHVTGAHLHFEIRTETHSGQVDPRAWLAAHGVHV